MIIIETHLACDKCGKIYSDDDGAKLSGIKGMEQRLRAATNGWVYSGSNDYCPLCRSKRKDGKNIKTRPKRKYK